MPVSAKTSATPEWKAKRAAYIREYRNRSGIRAKLAARVAARYKDPAVRASILAKAAAHQADPLWAAKKNLRMRVSRYGITEIDFWTKWAEQAGCCKICGIALSLMPKKPNTVCVDHKHGIKNRDLLCLKCNTGLGAYRDNPELLRKAAHYLEEHE